MGQTGVGMVMVMTLSSNAIHFPQVVRIMCAGFAEHLKGLDHKSTLFV